MQGVANYVRPTLAVLAALASIALAGCNSSAQSRNPAGQPPAPLVTVTEVASTDVPIFSEYRRPNLRAQQGRSARTRGRLHRQVAVPPGQEVHAGDVLYVLDLRPYEAAVAQAKGNLAQSDADLDFARKQVALLQAEANLAAAQANLVKDQQDSTV